MEKAAPQVPRDSNDNVVLGGGSMRRIACISPGGSFLCPGNVDDILRYSIGMQHKHQYRALEKPKPRLLCLSHPGTAMEPKVWKGHETSRLSRHFFFPLFSRHGAFLNWQLRKTLHVQLLLGRISRRADFRSLCRSFCRAGNRGHVCYRP